MYRCDNRQSEFTLRITGSGVARTQLDGPPPITVAADVEPKGGVAFPVFGVLRAGNPLTLRAVEARLPPGAVPFGLNASLEREGRALAGQVVRPGCEAFTMTRGVPGTTPGSDITAVAGPPVAATPTVDAVAATGRTPSILDFMPKGMLISEDECRRGMQEAMACAQRMVWQGRMQVQGDSWVQAVPPHWASFSQLNPELGVWTQENAPRGCPGRTKLRAWLRAIGEPDGWCQRYTEEAFRLHWTEGCLIGTDDNLREALGTLGLDVAQVLQLANSPGNKEALKAQTPRAIERGIFGAPSFVVGNELFWGDYRLEDAIDWALLHE